MDLHPEAFFQEEQRFRQWWLLVLVHGAGILLVALFAYGMIRQLLLGRPWGGKPMPDAVLAVMGPAMICLGLLLMWLFANLRLETQVRTGGLFLRFHPFHLRRDKHIPLEDAKQVRAVTYRPILEYGGWGIRIVPGGRAYNVSGNRGVRIDFSDGRHLLIGSQRPEELAEAIRSLL